MMTVHFANMAGEVIKKNHQSEQLSKVLCI
jgi:hypothetical protein